MPTLINLKYFCDVVETGSFTKAGEINHVAQTSISQQVKEIERELGTVLLDRKYKPVKLTQTGKVVYSEAKKVLKQYQIFNNKVQRYISDQNSQIRLGYNSAIDLKILERLGSSISNENFIVVKQSIKDEVQNLLDGKLDLIITYDTAIEKNPKIESYPISEGDLVVCAAITHPLASKNRVSVQEVYQYPLVMLSPNSVGQSFEIMAKRTELLGSKLNIKQEVEDVDSELFLIEHKNYLCFLPNDYPLEQAKKIKKIPFKDSPYKYQLRVAKLKNNYDKETVKLFELIKHFS